MVESWRCIPVVGCMAEMNYLMTTGGHASLDNLLNGRKAIVAVLKQMSASSKRLTVFINAIGPQLRRLGSRKLVKLLKEIGVNSKVQIIQLALAISYPKPRKLAGKLVLEHALPEGDLVQVWLSYIMGVRQFKENYAGQWENFGSDIRRMLRPEVYERLYGAAK